MPEDWAGWAATHPPAIRISKPTPTPASRSLRRLVFISSPTFTPFSLWVAGWSVLRGERRSGGYASRRNQEHRDRYMETWTRMLTIPGARHARVGDDREADRSFLYVAPTDRTRAANMGTPDLRLFPRK